MTQAVELLERAVAAEPNVASWHSNLSGLYRLHYRLEEALTAARLAVKLRPDAARYHVNLGKALIDCEHREEALISFLTALAREPQNAEAHLAIGQVLLARGDMRPGWIEYEWRNQLEQAKGMLPTMAAPAWNGMKLPNSRLLLVADQGYGDTIQFVRYVPLIADPRRGAGARLQPPTCCRCCATSPGEARPRRGGTRFPPHMAYCLLSSLPGILGTEVGTIPCSIPYLSAPADDVKAWRDKIDARFGRDRCASAWCGPGGRRIRTTVAVRSRCRCWRGWRSSTRFRWCPLQKVVPDRDKAALAGFPDMMDVSEGLTDFGQTAALISTLDLVITVDSAVGHLSGALGKPVWVMMPTPSDWRWLLDRSDSPWYPSMRMFRQPRPGDWTSVIANVVHAAAGLQKPKTRGRRRRRPPETAGLRKPGF